jgi:hypothetical protein
VSEIEQASREAVEAARQGEQFQLMLAAIQAAAQQQPAHTHPAPVPAARTSGSAAKWVGIGVAGAFLAVALSVALVSTAIATVCLTVCVLIVRDVWKSLRSKG